MRTTSGPFVLAALAAAVIATAGCAARYVRAPQEGAAPTGLPSAVTDHVLLVSIDGLRPDAIGAFRAPTLQRLTDEGSYALTAHTIVPSETLPSHTSMLTGQPPERHGVLWNTVVTADADIVALPTVFAVARARGYRTAAFFSKPKFGPLQQPGSLDYSQAPGGWFGGWTADRTATDVETYLTTARPNLLFVHLSDPDRAGHAHGWMSPHYGRGVQNADAALARLLAAADRAFGAGQYSAIVSADHGGHDRDHGSADPRDTTIPWIAWGRGVQPGPLASDVITMDTAATVLWLLGLTKPEDWAGQPVFAAFSHGPR